MHPEEHLSDDLDVEREVDECIEGMLNQRNAEHSVVVMTMNLRRYASVPRDWQAVHRELTRILVDAPDVVCLQEGLEGMDILSQVGYKRIASSVLRAQALRDAVYGSPTELKTCSSSSHGRLLVNELYIRAAGSKWEAIDSGAAQISSDLILNMEGPGERQGCGTWPLATRCVVWTKLRHCQKPAGPFVYVLNTQLSGGHEDPHFLALAEERELQMQRLLELFDAHLGVSEGDLGILAGGLGAHPKDIGPALVADASNSGFNTDELRQRFQDYLAAPFNVLADHGWKLAYDQFEVGSTSPEGRLVDHMVTSYDIPVQAEVVSSGSHVCLSDHDFVKAKFSLKFQQAKDNRKVHLHSAVREHRVAAMAQGLRSAQWMKNGAFAAAAEAGANQRMRLRCEQEDLRRQRDTEKYAADELKAELNSEIRELRDRCLEQGQTVGLLTQRLRDARSAIAAELQDAATERAALRGELMSEESQRQKLQAALMHEEAEASSRVEAADQQLASMVAVRDSLQVQLQLALKVQAELRQDIAAEREGRAELEVAGERELVAWERIKESSQASPTMRSVHDEHSRLRQHLNAEAAICEQEAEAFRKSLHELSEEIQESTDNKQRAIAALGAVGCEWPVLQEEAAEAIERASAKEAEVEGVRRRARDYEKQLERLREDILQCRQDNIALELKKERDLVNEEVHTEALRQEELLMELDAARRSRSIFQCLFPRSPPPPPPPSTPPPQRTKPPPPRQMSFADRSALSQPDPRLERAPTSAAPQERRHAEAHNMPESSSDESSSGSDSEEKPARPPARGRREPDLIESDEV